MALHVETFGTGPRVVLLHADVANGRTGWQRQQPLAEHVELVVPDRPGYGRSMPESRVDFESEVDLVAPLLGEGAHLVGHSYGGVVALLVAQRHPTLVRTLTVVEPPAFSVAPEDPDVAGLLAGLGKVWEEEPENPERFFARFADLMGERAWPRSPMPPAMEHGVRQLMAERRPEEAHIDLPAIQAGGIPTLVVSGGHQAGLEAICDVIASATGARREVITGARHAVPRTGAPFNDLLRDFWGGHP